MLKSIEAVIYQDGRVVLKEPIDLKVSHKAIVTILDEKADLPEISETALLSEQALAADWNKPEEETTESAIEIASITDLSDDFLSPEEVDYYLQLDDNI